MGEFFSLWGGGRRPPPLPQLVSDRGRDCEGGGTVEAGVVYVIVGKGGEVLFSLGGESRLAPPPGLDVAGDKVVREGEK